MKLQMPGKLDKLVIGSQRRKEIVAIPDDLTPLPPSSEELQTLGSGAPKQPQRVVTQVDRDSPKLALIGNRAKGFVWVERGAGVRSGVIKWSAAVLVPQFRHDG